MAYQSLEEYKAARALKKSQSPKCSTCQKDLLEASTGNRWTAEGPKCSDDYFREFGDAIESMPIITPRVRRG